MEFLLSLVMASCIYNPTTGLRLIESDDSVSYMQSLPKQTPSEVSLEKYGDYGDYYDPGSNQTESVNETAVHHYMKQLALLGPSTKAYGGPNIKNRFSFTFFSTKTKRWINTRKKITKYSPTTHVYSYKQRKTKYSQTTPNPNRRTRPTLRLLYFSTAPVRRKRLSCDCSEIAEQCNNFDKELIYSSARSIRRKRWVGDSPERMDKYTTFDSLDRELLYSGRYAPWQIKLYALRKYYDRNESLPISTKKRVIGKQRLKKILRKKSIHEPDYHEKLRMMSWEAIYNNSDVIWNSTQRQIVLEKKWLHLTEKMPVV